MRKMPDLRSVLPLPTLRESRIDRLSYENGFSFAALDHVLPFFPPMASLVFHHHAGGFHWATLRVSFCLQLPR